MTPQRFAPFGAEDGAEHSGVEFSQVSGHGVDNSQRQRHLADSGGHWPASSAERDTAFDLAT